MSFQDRRPTVATTNRRKAMRFLTIIAAIMLTVATGYAQQQRNSDHIPPDNVRWQDTGWTLDIGGALDFNGTTIDLDPTGAYTLDMDATSVLTLSIAPNLAAAYVLQDTAGADFLNIDTTGDTITLGNATTNPAFTLLGSGAFTFGTGVTAMSAGLNLDGDLDWDSDTIDELITIDSTDVLHTSGLVTVTDLRAGVNNDNTDEATLRLVSSGTFAVDIESGAFSADEPLQNKANVGTPGTNVTAAEYGDGYQHVTVLTLTAAEFTPTIPADAEAAGMIIYTFPAGVYVVTAVHMDITSGVMDTATNAADLGIGSVIASGDFATLDLAPAGSEDILTGQTVADVSTFVDESSAIPTAGAPLLFEAGGSHVLHLNVAATWNATVATASATGTVTIYWTFLGS